MNPNIDTVDELIAALNSFAQSSHSTDANGDSHVKRTDLDRAINELATYLLAYIKLCS